MQFKSFASCAALALAAVGTPASALKINLFDVGGVTGSKAELGFKIAARYWENTFTNNAVVNFNVSFAKLGPNVLGSTGSSLFTYVPVDDYKFLLGATGTTKLDSVAVANLAPTSATGSLNVIVPEYFNPATLDGVAATGTRLAPDGTAIANSIALTTSNVKALIGGFEDVIDGQITFSSEFAFDYNPEDGIAAGKSDFIGVAIHEMGHALGFISGADDFNYSVGGGFPVDDFWWGYGLDMFRYTSPGQLDWTFGSEAYFSIDGGLTEFNDRSKFSTGEDYGDGWQASHWKAPQLPNGNFSCAMPKIGIMNPYLCSGRTAIVTGTDLALFDAIGWNTNVDVIADPNYMIGTDAIHAAFVPEPGTWAMMLGGFGMLGAAMRRRRRDVKVQVSFG